MKKLLSLILIFLLLFPLVAQVSPQPYEAEEFPQWLYNIGRFEAIFIGAIPLTFLLGGLTYSFSRYSYYSITEGRNAGEYLPTWINSSANPTTAEDQVRIIYLSLFLAGAVATIDFVIEQNKRTHE